MRARAGGLIARRRRAGEHRTLTSYRIREEMHYGAHSRRAPQVRMHDERERTLEGRALDHQGAEAVTCLDEEMRQERDANAGPRGAIKREEIVRAERHALSRLRSPLFRFQGNCRPDCRNRRSSMASDDVARYFKAVP
jgi:hypothetical protein